MLSIEPETQLDNAMQNHQHHAATPRNYFVIFGILMGLTATTVGASFLELGPLNLTVALAIAGTKALLVLLFFMHLIHSNRLNCIAIAGAVYFFAILVVLTMSDYGARG